MAGIGFELKKLFSKKGLTLSIRAYVFSIFVTVGPLIITVFTITLLSNILELLGVSRSNLEIIQGVILYAFAFSVVFTSGLCMMLSRYLADLLYEENYDQILATLYGALVFIVLPLGVVGFLFLFRSPIDTLLKFLGYSLFLSLACEMVIAVFISAVKDFKSIAYSFVAGLISGLIIGGLYTKISGDIVAGVLLGFSTCFWIANGFLIWNIGSYYQVDNGKYFDFIRYFEKVGVLFWVNSFYVLTLYIHNFVFWIFSDFQHWIGETFVYTPFYDIPAGYAFITMIPTMVIFVVKIETVFYDKYKLFYDQVNKNACYKDINVAKIDMIEVVFNEIVFMMEVQFFFSVGFLILGLEFLPYIGFSSGMIDMFILLTFAYYCMIIDFVLMTIMLYYDYKKGAFKLSLFVVVGNGVFTYISIILGSSFYGVGFLVASFTGLIYGLHLLKTYLKELEYNIFCSQAVWHAKDDGIIANFIKRLNRLVETDYEKS